MPRRSHELGGQCPDFLDPDLYHVAGLEKLPPRRAYPGRGAREDQVAGVEGHTVRQALDLLRKGLKPEAIIKQILDADTDPLPERWTKQGRQFAVMNLKGEFAAYTGPKASTWAGNKSGKFATAQGNILAGPQVVDNMIERFESTPGHLSQRLVAALEGGQAGGGDKRGQQSAALVIVKKNCGVWLHNDTVLRLQVDDNPEPIKELKRVVEKWNERRPRSVTPECK